VLREGLVLKLFLALWMTNDYMYFSPLFPTLRYAASSVDILPQGSGLGVLEGAGEVSQTFIRTWHAPAVLILTAVKTGANEVHTALKAHGYMCNNHSNTNRG
jgi:hypothetical protein